MPYAVVIEKADNNYSAYVPDLPGCIATCKGIAEVKRSSAAPSASISTDCARTACPFRSRSASRNT